MSYHDDYIYSIGWTNPRVSHADSLNQQPQSTHDVRITQETRLIKTEWLLEEVKTYLRQQIDNQEAQTLLQKIEGEL
jgi:hypothetical protein